MASTPRIEKLLRRQVRELERLEVGEARALLSAFEQTRRELRERVEALAARTAETTFTQQHLRVMLAQVDEAVRNLSRRMATEAGRQFDSTRDKAAQHLIDQIAAAEPDFIDAGGQLEVAIARRLNVEGGLLLHAHSLERYGLDLIGHWQRQLVVGVGSGETWNQMRDRLFATNAARLDGFRHRAALIVRMEANSAYNRAHLASLQEAAQIVDGGTDGPDPLMRQADEAIDLRNHPISRALDGKITALDEPWRVPVSEVRGHAEALGKGLGGITWPRVGTEFVGMTYPAHFNERGRQVAYRRSWGD